MANGAGQSAVMAALTAGVGVFILHAGIEIMMSPPTVTRLGQDEGQASYMQGAIVLGLGIALMAAAAKLLVVAIGDAFVLESRSPEEVWEEMSVSLQSRLHFTVTEGYSRVVLKEENLHEMMRLPEQRHVRFVGKKNGVVEISGPMSKFITKASDEEIRAFRATPVVVKQELPETFWTPTPTVAIPAQNY